ncbi:hypothetical protein DIPPA_29261 [Diplonema papillatum]|nr:hypothetical protein DIPPA_29249 [Diplonema papillatum]KAJ9455697.1 hypothetical protein DIPPA_29261 [Diplonema papillatum]
MCTACVRIRQRRFNDPATPNSSLPRFVPYVIPENRNSQAPIPFCFDRALRQR